MSVKLPLRYSESQFLSTPITEAQEKAILTSHRRRCASAEQAGGRQHSQSVLEHKQRHITRLVQPDRQRTYRCRVRVTTVAIENKTKRSQCTVETQVCQQHGNTGKC